MVPAALALVVASCASSSEPAENSGVVGRVLSRPSCPETRAVGPCPDRPVPRAVVTGGGRRTIAGPDGRFRLSLPPGRYRLEARAAAATHPSTASVRVVVRDRRYSRVRVIVDSGIR